MTEAAPQRDDSPRELFNGLRYAIGRGIACGAMLNGFPPLAGGVSAVAALAGSGLL